MNLISEFSHERDESFLIITTIPMTRGWTPINHMLNVLGTYLNCRTLHLDDRSLSPMEKLSAYFTARRRVAGKPNLLIVVQTAAQLNQIFTLRGWRSSFNFAAAWIIDSFHTEHLPRFSVRNIVDQLFITSGADIDEYQEKSGVPTSVLLWGSDVLQFGGSGGARPFDVLRVGRQPPAWEDDEDNKHCLAAHGLTYCGRPPDFGVDSNAQKALMQEYMQKSKFALAYSNRVDGSHYTHSKKEYITARWLDAIASGCQIVGVPPRSDHAFAKLLWPEALLELTDTSRPHALQVIQQAAADWNPAIAQFNYRMALEKLDWRWRFIEISNTFQLHSNALHADIEKIRGLIFDEQIPCNPDAQNLPSN